MDSVGSVGEDSSRMSKNILSPRVSKLFSLSLVPCGMCAVQSILVTLWCELHTKQYIGNTSVKLFIKSCHISDQEVAITTVNTCI